MSTRATNFTVLLLMLALFASGVGSFLVATPAGKPVVWSHAVAGFALTVVLYWKGKVIVRSLRRRGVGWWVLPSLVLLGLLLAALVVGVAYATIGFPAVAGYPAMTVHVLLALGTALLLVPHVWIGWPRPRPRDFANRRLLLRRSVILAAGAGVWLVVEGMNRVAGLSGAARRFTGSRPVLAVGAQAFPVTSWLFDDPEPVDRPSWSVRVKGRVAAPQSITAGGASWKARMTATIDCTGGWYAERTWSGLPLRALLEQAGVEPGARSVVVRSVTGYARRFSLDAAGRALLAVAINGELLTHGHGAPVRLVLPGARGYEWVKWVAEVEVSGRPAFLRLPLPRS